MFAKPFRIKSQTAIRSSDRKKIKADVSKAFPTLSEEDLSAVFPTKEEMSAMKVYSHSGENIMVYCLKKTPIFFELEKSIYPTVYTLWQFPELAPCFTTHTPVVSKLQGGADLMLPGVVTPGPVFPETFQHFQKGDKCQINTVDNRAAVAVGMTAMSGSDMYESGMRGKGIHILHVYKDHLWSHGDQQEPPSLGPVVFTSTSGDVDNSDDSDVTDGGDATTSSLVSDVTETLESAAISDVGGNVVKEQQDEGDNVPEEEEEEEFRETPESMDSLLYHCFMCAMLAEVKKDDLPLLTSKLLRTLMVPWCPSGRVLDLKKSSYKKLTKFLHAMVARNLIVVKELTKGVESVTEVNRGHTEFKQFVSPEKPVKPLDEDPATLERVFQPPRLEELYAVSGNTLPIFKESGIGKGMPLDAIEVRKYVKAYVRANNLTVENDPRLVTLDPVLSDALLNKNERDTTHLHWDQLFVRCMEKMSAVTRISYPGREPRLVKGKLQNIQLSVVQRSGNKKVTLVDNLEQFGIDEAAFAHEVQIGVAGSTGVHAAPGKKSLQVMVQGNQVVFIADLLMGKYALNKKYISGLDKAPKGKKKR